MTGITTVRGSLGVFSTNGNVDLREANDVGEFLSGFAGPNKDFLFTNVSPLKLQNVSANFVTNRTRITSGFFAAPVDLAFPFDPCSIAPEICSLVNPFDTNRYDPDEEKKKKDELECS